MLVCLGARFRRLFLKVGGCWGLGLGKEMEGVFPLNSRERATPPQTRHASTREHYITGMWPDYLQILAKVCASDLTRILY